MTTCQHGVLLSAQRTMPLWQRWISANWAYESASSSLIGREVLLQPRPISASVYSKLSTMSMRTRCCAPVTGLRIGSPRPSVTPGTTKRAFRAAISTWNSIVAKMGSCTFSRVDANTLKTVAPGSVSCPLAQQRRTLALIGPLVDHDRGLTLSLMNGARPPEDSHELQAIEGGRSVMTALDLESANRLTVAVRRQPVELAGAAI